MFSCPNFCGLDMFIDRMDGNVAVNVEHNKLSASNVLNILPNDWETIKTNTDLFIETGAGNSTYRINTMKWNQLVSTLIGDTKKEVAIICNKNSHSGHSSKATFNFSRSDFVGTNIPRDDKYKNFRFESFDFFTLHISSCLVPNSNSSCSCSSSSNVISSSSNVISSSSGGGSSGGGIEGRSSSRCPTSSLRLRVPSFDEATLEATLREQLVLAPSELLDELLNQYLTDKVSNLHKGGFKQPIEIVVTFNNNKKGSCFYLSHHVSNSVISLARKFRYYR